MPRRRGAQEGYYGTTDSAHVAPAQFSPDVVAELTHALRGVLEDQRASTNAWRAHALYRLCSEAHIHALGSERMLVAVKRTWACIDHDAPMHQDQKLVVFESIVTLCLKSYYGNC